MLNFYNHAQMKKLRNAGRIAFGAVAISLIAFASEAQVGIGTTLPQAKLHVHDGSIFGTTSELPAENDPFYDPDIPLTMQYHFRWFHDKSAFRSVGERTGVGTLEAQNIGAFSFASGYETWAPGVGATALGLRTTATGTGALAMGYGSLASSAHTFAVGYNAIASGGTSVAMGEYVSTNGKNYSFVFGTAVGKTLQSDIDRQMVMGFSGGYKLYTNGAASIGVSLAAGGNSWSVISDVNKKENFAPVNGEDFLQKINKMSLTSWNYKGQDAKAFRHYGPMAQDFYNAFGQDEYGTIGTDTTINQADFDGVNLIAIQALIRKMEQMSAEIVKIKAQLGEAQSAVGKRKKRIRENPKQYLTSRKMKSISYSLRR